MLRQGDWRLCIAAVEAPTTNPAAHAACLHEIEFSFLNSNLMVPTGHLLIL